MKTFTLVLMLLLFFSLHMELSAQDLTLKRGDQNLSGRKIDENTWLFSIDGVPFLLMKKAELDTLVRKYKLLKNDLDRTNKVIAAKDTLLESFLTYESRADEHIATQKQLINTADSLYVGYKGMYNDLKKMLGLASTFSIVGGVGLLDPPNAGWRPVVSAGLGVGNWIGQFQYGKDYKGLLFSARLPLGF